jgi:hypothetical protein
MSQWATEPNDRCEFCGALLIPAEETKKKQEAEEKENLKEESILDIKEGDSPFVVFIKKVGWVFQMIFAAILSFFIWVISIVTG